MAFQTIQVNLHVLSLKPSNTSQFVPLFRAHEEVVVGLVIFHANEVTLDLHASSARH